MPPQHLVAQVDGQPVSPHRPQAHERGHRAERGDSLLLLGLTRLLTASTTTAAAAVIGEREWVAEELAAALINPEESQVAPTGKLSVTTATKVGNGE